MNKSNFTLLLFILISVLSPCYGVAQTIAGAQITLHIQDYCLMDTNGAPVNLTLTSSVAGAPITSVTNSDMYVRVSSLTPGGTYRKVTARVSSGTVPAGTRLTLEAALSTNTNGAGASGIVSPAIILSSIDQTLIHGIGSYYTGTGLTDGYRLTYIWGAYNPTTNYHLLNATVAPTTLTIILTISAPDGNNI
ncbi:MAG: hypothetical protein WC833_11415 [Bacteroidales bacterium]|jgi:hypothetical protein